MSKNKFSDTGEDKSPKIPQKKKIDFDLNVRDFKWTEKQINLII